MSENRSEKTATARKEPVQVTVLGFCILAIIVGVALWFVFQREFPGLVHGPDGVIADQYSRCIAGTRIVDGIPVTTRYEPEYIRIRIEHGELTYDDIAAKMDELDCEPVDWANVLPKEEFEDDHERRSR